MNDILITMRQRAALLKVALDANKTATTAHHQAWQRWTAEDKHTQESSGAIVATEETRDTTLDKVIAKAQSLLETVVLFARLHPGRTYQQIGLQAASLQAALDREVVAFTAYSKVSGAGDLFNHRARETWQTAKESIAQSAFHLWFEIARAPDLPTIPAALPSQSQIDTDLDDTDTAEWPAVRSLPPFLAKRQVHSSD